jgi:GAF domain-containing protein
MRKSDKGAPPGFIEDVLRDLEYAPCRTIALASGYRAVQSTPLISSSGTFVGVLSRHFATPHRPPMEEMLALSELAESTANAIILRRRLM